LENEAFVQQFDEIEQKVGRLIQASQALEATNAELRQKIESLERELQGKTKNERSYIEERDLIRSKIDNLLVRLTDITEST